MFIKYVKHKTHQGTHYCYFYFGDVAKTVAKRDFYKQFESHLIMENPLIDSFVNVLQHQGTLELSDILAYIKLDHEIEYAVGMKIGHQWYGQDTTREIFNSIDSIKNSENLGVTWQNVDSNTPWSFIKGSHDSFYIFNPLQSHVFIDHNRETWEEKSRTEGLRVVHCDKLVDTPMMAKEQQWPGWEEGKYDNLTQHNYLDIDLSMQNENKEKMKAEVGVGIYSNSTLGSENKKELFSKKRKKIIYHSIYESQIKTQLDEFEEKIPFDHWDDLFTLFENDVSDAVILLGGLASFNFFPKAMKSDKVLAFVYRITSMPKTSVWANCPHTDQQVFINE